MKFDLRRPCAECPFRNDRPGYLTEERAEEIADAVTSSRGSTFTCHKTTIPDPASDGEMMDGPNAQHCAGALILAEKGGTVGQMVRIAERLGLYDASKLDMDAPIFEDAEEMIEHHAARRKSAKVRQRD